MDYRRDNATLFTMNPGNTALLSDEQSANAQAMINAALAEHGVKGAAARVIFHDLMVRVEITPPFVLSMRLGSNVLPLAEAISVYFSNANPEVVDHDAKFRAWELARSTAIKSRAELARQVAERSIASARFDAWKKLPATSRAVLRVGDNAGAVALAQALESEAKTVSTPPDNWTPSAA